VSANGFILTIRAAGSGGIAATTWGRRTTDEDQRQKKLENDAAGISSTSSFIANPATASAARRSGKLFALGV
jgi:hypothetical protein